MQPGMRGTRIAVGVLACAALAPSTLGCHSMTGMLPALSVGIRARVPSTSSGSARVLLGCWLDWAGRSEAPGERVAAQLFPATAIELDSWPCRSAATCAWEHDARQAALARAPLLGRGETP